MTNETKSTLTVATSLQSAFDYFNRALFRGNLPDVLITLNRKAGTYGYFSKQRFTRRGTQSTFPLVNKNNILSEISLNPDTFDRSDTEILATLVHEMCHHWQHHFGNNPSKTAGYHNAEWANKMRQVGLQPISETTGTRGTGKRVSHEINETGPFLRDCQEFLATNKEFDLSWTSKERKPARKKHNKTVFRYDCPTCDNWVRGPVDTSVVCGDCIEPMEMEGEKYPNLPPYNA